MNPVRQISLPVMMCSVEVRKIFEILGKDSVRFVGGCVRNALLKEEIGDIDLATVYPPQYVTDRFLENRIKSIPTGIQHGTVTVVINGKTFEITTLRIDKNPDGRHAEVEFLNDWVADARRRDFTMNALYADLDGNIYDPLGQGLIDLEKRKICFVGDPDLRIREDYLRILRFFRFFTQYGQGKIDRPGFDACVRGAAGLKKLSRERVSQEFFKIMSHPRAVIGLSHMKNSRILSVLFSRSFDPVVLKNLIDIQSAPLGDVALMARLSVVVGCSRRSFEKLPNYLILKRNQRQIFGKICDVQINTIRIDLLKVRMWAVYDGVGMARARVDLALAYGYISKSDYKKLIASVLENPIPEFPLRGGDLSRLGYRGELLGETLDRLKKQWIRSGFSLSRHQLLSKVRVL